MTKEILKLTMFNRKHLLICALLILTIPQSSIGQQTESEACRRAKNFYQACYFSCIGSTPGGVAYAANVCGTKCSAEKTNILNFCN
jgi:hypothetical protein